jgi:preprotein translocase subunit SecF
VNVVGFYQTIRHVYDKQYKKLELIPTVLLILAIVVLAFSYATTGEFIQKGVSLKGGLTLTAPTPDSVDVNVLEQSLIKALPQADINVRALTQGTHTTYVIVEASDVTEEQIVAAMNAAGVQLHKGDYSLEEMGSELGQNFFRQTQWAIALAFISMAVIVFITFRKVLPSSYVVLAAISTILMTLATANLMGVRLGTGGVAAFLMLIGYSVDTDILLTTRVMRQKEGTVFDRTVGAVKTGLTMTLTSLAAVLVGFFITHSDVIKQIMLILAIGLVFDIINTWLQNAAILRRYMERKEGGHV